MATYLYTPHSPAPGTPYTCALPSPLSADAASSTHASYQCAPRDCPSASAPPTPPASSHPAQSSAETPSGWKPGPRGRNASWTGLCPSGCLRSRRKPDQEQQNHAHGYAPSRKLFAGLGAVSRRLWRRARRACGLRAGRRSIRGSGGSGGGSFGVCSELDVQVRRCFGRRRSSMRWFYSGCRSGRGSLWRSMLRRFGRTLVLCVSRSRGRGDFL